jgi:hypothetical protein
VTIVTLALAFVAQVGTYGMSDNWERRGKKISGYCHGNGKGTITEFQQGI